MLKRLIELYHNYRYALKVPNPDTYRSNQIRILLFVGLGADILFSITYLVLIITDPRFKDDLLPVVLSVTFFLGLGAVAIMNSKLFDQVGAHALFVALLFISVTLVPNVSYALLLVMLVKVVILSGTLTRPVFTWVYGIIGFVLFAATSFGKYPFLQVFGFMAIYSYAIIAGYILAEIMNSLFAMHAESTNSMQQLYLNDKKLFSSLAHRLKTPVAILKGQLMNRKDTNNKSMLRPLDEITAAVNELTVLSKMNLSKALATKQKVDLQELLKDLQHDAEILAANHERQHGQRRDIKLTTNTTLQSIIYVAPQQIKEALLNIIDNSIRHNAAKQNLIVTLELAAKNKKYYITIKDDGVGIAESRLKDVLSKHTIVNDSEDSPINMHVGIEIARNLIQTNNGDLFIYSQPGLGTTVEVILRQS
jgi:signal transduction histidine kinase